LTLIRQPAGARLRCCFAVHCRQVVEQRLRYDNTASCAEKLQNSPCKLPKAASPDSESYVPQDPLCWRNVSAALYDNECEVPVTVEKDMKGPVYFYYELRNFFQVRRAMLRSAVLQTVHAMMPPPLICSPLLGRTSASTSNHKRPNNSGATRSSRSRCASTTFMRTTEGARGVSDGTC
jgi:hypothetical protein